MLTPIYFCCQVCCDSYSESEGTKNKQAHRDASIHRSTPQSSLLSTASTCTFVNLCVGMMKRLVIGLRFSPPGTQFLLKPGWALAPPPSLHRRCLRSQPQTSLRRPSICPDRLKTHAATLHLSLLMDFITAPFAFLSPVISNCALSLHHPPSFFFSLRCSGSQKRNDIMSKGS